MVVLKKKNLLLDRRSFPWTQQQRSKPSFSLEVWQHSVYRPCWHFIASNKLKQSISWNGQSWMCSSSVLGHFGHRTSKVLIPVHPCHTWIYQIMLTQFLCHVELWLELPESFSSILFQFHRLKHWYMETKCLVAASIMFSKGLLLSKVHSASCRSHGTKDLISPALALSFGEVYWPLAFFFLIIKGVKLVSLLDQPGLFLYQDCKCLCKTLHCCLMSLPGKQGSTWNNKLPAKSAAIPKSMQCNQSITNVSNVTPGMENKGDTNLHSCKCCHKVFLCDLQAAVKLGSLMSADVAWHL